MAMEFQTVFLVAASCLGFISLCKQIFSFFRWVWVMFLRPPKNLKKEYGSWAVITGSTDGIGKALAFELASKGLSLVLVGRNPSKLEATSNEIRARFGDLKVDIKNVVVDLEKWSGQEISKAIEGVIEELDVGILINNAGVSYPNARYFHEVDRNMMESLIKVNSEAATWVTRAVLPAMLKKKKGAILNMGSGSVAVLPSFPLFAIYASTKAYVYPYMFLKFFFFFPFFIFQGIDHPKSNINPGNHFNKPIIVGKLKCIKVSGEKPAGSLPVPAN